MLINIPDDATVEEFKKKGLEKIEKYIAWIGNHDIMSFTEKCLKTLTPSYFWYIPASLTGKHHPSWAKEEGGLLLHTIATVIIADELSGTYGLSGVDYDCAISASLLHDTIKYGIEFDENYYAMHPYLPRDRYCNEWSGLSWMIDRESQDKIFNAIESHQGSIHNGQWHSVGKIKPETAIEKVVHLADYIASRKNITIEFR